MSPSNGSQRNLRPYDVTVHQESTAEPIADDIVTKTDKLIRKLAEAGGRTENAGQPPRDLQTHPQPYHDDVDEEGRSPPSVTAGAPDMASPYRGGDGWDAPPGYEFAAAAPTSAAASRSYQHDEDSRTASVTSAAEAARRAEEDAARAAEAARELAADGETPKSRLPSMGGSSSSSSYVSDGVQTCVRSMLQCLSVEGPLLGYSSAPDVGEPSVSSMNPNGGGVAYGRPSSENTGLLGSAMLR